VRATFYDQANTVEGDVRMPALDAVDAGYVAFGRWSGNPVVRTYTDEIEIHPGVASNDA
jgi:hypothetical protein